MNSDCPRLLGHVAFVSLTCVTFSLSLSILSPLSPPPLKRLRQRDIEQGSRSVFSVSVCPWIELESHLLCYSLCKVFLAFRSFVRFFCRCISLLILSIWVPHGAIIYLLAGSKIVIITYLSRILI